MKIAYLSTFYPFRGGIAQFNASLLRIFEKEHIIKAFTFTRQYPDFLFPGQSQFVGDKDNVDKITAEAVLDSFVPLKYSSAARKISEYKPDMMLMKYWMPYFAPSLGWVSKKLKKKNVKNIAILDNVIPHERRPGDIILTKFFFRQCHGFVVMSENVREDLLMLKPEANYVFQPHPLYDHFGKKLPKEDVRQKLNIPIDKKVLLFFGFIRSYKGLDILLETLAKLPDDYLLIIAGEVYGDFKEYDELIEKNNLQSKVLLHVRYISDDVVPVFFSASDVCILPYKSATQSGIVGIAYHFDLPVIATDVGGLGEMIEPYETGIMIPRPNSDLFKIAIEKYFEMNLRDRFEANISNYKKKASWESLAKSIIELYELVQS